ncbi:pectate lyase-like [Rosa rugosa]|uniref:pectate lyase-like n=1 Tax=Rosa rugosa TaxID=74645 RepID=UPI002B40D97D|nr:pectate lyase-like [Rosa rugosa]
MSQTMALNRLGSIFLVLFLLFCVAVIVNAENDTAEDEYWKERAAVAMKIAEESVHPNPQEVTEEINADVHELIMGQNSTKRKLRGSKGYDGPCEATNPIDACWRCDPDWADNREKIVDCVKGFGKKTTGGKGGPIYIVTDDSDDDIVNPKPGTLRDAVIQKGPLWIIFEHSMVIRLQQELMVSSDKTIDGRGANVVIAFGGGITLQYVKNIIITNIHVKDIDSKAGGMIRDCVDHFGFRTRSDGDGISLFGASNVWIDHVSMARCDDGLIDAIMSSTAITISNSHFTDHNEAMLFGASNSYSQDKIMQVTVAFNHFGQGLIQRMPRCRFGFFHVVNNDYTHWIMYAIGGNMNPTIISQGNRYIAPESHVAKEVTKREYTDESEWKHWNWRSEGDLMVNGAYFVESGDPNVAKSEKIEMLPFKPGTLASTLTRFSGALECCVGQPC